MLVARPAKPRHREAPLESTSMAKLVRFSLSGWLAAPAPPDQGFCWARCVALGEGSCGEACGLCCHHGPRWSTTVRISDAASSQSREPVTPRKASSDTGCAAHASWGGTHAVAHG